MEIVTAYTPERERKPWVAGVLSVLLPGLGHVYLGRPELGVCWFATIQLLVLAYALIARSPLLPPVLTLGGILIPLTGYIFIILSAVRLARSMRQTHKPNGWNRWYVYLGVLVVGASISSFLSDVLKEVVVRSYKIPARSMIPTLLIGDHILVDNLIYRLGNHPGRGDIIVFRFPEDEEKDFIKRVVGTPGDTIQLRNKAVLVNGVVLDDKSFTQRIDPGIIDGTINPRDNFGPVTVPEGSYFVMGDNRDQSLDSRFWGFVREEKIRGKAFRIYWSWNGQGQMTEWVRWERFGKAIQ
jgi:signal peptidase I